MEVMKKSLVDMYNRIEPWIDPKTRFSTLSLKNEAPQDIVELYEEWNRMVKSEPIEAHYL